MTGTPLFPRRLLPLILQLSAAALVAAAGASLAAPVAPVAQGDIGGPKWSELSPGQRQALAPLANDWDSIDGRGKERWLGVAGRFPKMPPAEQARANQRMGEWARMTPQQRTQARINFQDARELPRQEREERWKAYQALPEDQKREFAQKRAALAAAASAASTSGANARRHPSVEDLQPKNNVVAPPAAAGGRTPVEPGSTVLRAGPGATTNLLTKRTNPPAHQRDGQPKIAVGRGDVDRTTLLPRRGPQAAVAGSNGASGSQKR